MGEVVDITVYRCRKLAQRRVARALAKARQHPSRDAGLDYDVPVPRPVTAAVVPFSPPYRRTGGP